MSPEETQTAPVNQPTSPKTAATLNVPVLVACFVAGGLGVYGKLHEPTGIAVNVAGFSSPQTVKVWLATLAFVLAIVVNNGKAIAYVCDGKKVEAWLNGTMANGQVDLKGPQGSLKGTYGGGQVKGNVTAGTKSWGFTVKTATAPSGLYRSAASLRNKLDASWVVLPDGKQVGVQKNKNGETSEAPPFDVNSKTATVDGTKIPIEAGDPNASTAGY